MNELQGGLAESVVLLSIESGPTEFDVSPGALVELRKQGVSNAVLHAMLAAKARQQAAATEAPVPDPAATVRSPPPSSNARSKRSFPVFPVAFFAEQYSWANGKPPARTGTLFVGFGRLRFAGGDATTMVIDPASLSGSERRTDGTVQPIRGFQGVRGALSQLGPNPYWLPADPQNPCRFWLGVVCHPIREEVLGGRAVMHWQLDYTDEEQSWSSQAWIDLKLHIVSRLEAPGHVMELRHIIEASQPQSLFQAP